VTNMGASFKSEDGFTPADRAVLPAEVDALWGTTGSQTERIHRVLEGFLAATGRSCSLAETRRLLRAANCSVSKYVANHDPVSIAQHFAARNMKTVRMIVVAFSAWAFSQGLDYKSLFSVNSGKNNRGRGEWMVQSEKRETSSHDAGGDNLGKLALLSMLLRPVHSTDLETLFDGDIRPEDIPGWKPEHFAAYPGLAVALGHVHGTVGCALKESATSNMGHYWQMLNLSADMLQSDSNAIDYYRDPTGAPKPIQVQELDNAHGGADLEHGFTMGLDFFLYDRDANISPANAGQYSRFYAHEAVQGSIANRTNGAPIPVPHASPSTATTEELGEVLELCCDKLVSVANGATMKMGGGHVTVLRSNLDAAGDFKARPAEVKRFIDATTAEKAAFKASPMPSYEGDSANGSKVADLYRLVWRCMQNTDPATRIFLRGPHCSQWIKRALDVNTFLKPSRAPDAFHALLESWGGFLPVVLPSLKPEKQPDDTKDTGGSYMGLGESIEQAAELKKLVGKPGLHYPPSLLDQLWKHPSVKLAETWEATGTLPDSLWSKLRRLLRYPRVTLKLEIERRMSMAKRRDANADLETAQENSGVQKAVFDYLLSLPSADRRVPAMKTLLLGYGMPKRDVPKHRAQCVAAIFKRAQLIAIPTAAATPPRAVRPSAAVPPATAATSNASAAVAAAVAAVAAATAATTTAADAAPTTPTAPTAPIPTHLVLSAASAASAAVVAALARAEANAEAAVREEAAVEAQQAEVVRMEQGGEPTVGGSSDVEEAAEAEEEEGLLPVEPVQLTTVAHAEQLLDALSAYAERPTSMWGCCDGVREGMGTPYYCGTCKLWHHPRCQPNTSRGREAPLCAPCRDKVLQGGTRRSTRRIVF